jgi:hypothetical protein
VKARKSSSARARQRCANLSRLAEHRDHHHPLDARQLGDDLGELVEHEGLAAVVVAVAGDQHLGLDLAEAVEHALHAEVGRAGRPDGAELAAASMPITASGMFGR